MATNGATKGQCTTCKGIFSEQVAIRHYDECFFESDQTYGEKCFLVKVSSVSPLYWLYIAVPTKCTLTDIDALLRILWLECCGHLSAFTVHGERYEALPKEDNPGLDVKLSKIFMKGLKVSYEYDFGSTTCLTLEIVNIYRSTLDSRAYLLMRNLPPELVCSNCPQPATLICSLCGATLCNKHSSHDAKNECGCDCLLPIQNSPRAGECGYAG